MNAEMPTQERRRVHLALSRPSLVGARPASPAVRKIANRSEFEEGDAGVAPTDGPVDFDFSAISTSRRSSIFSGVLS